MAKYGAVSATSRPHEGLVAIRPRSRVFEDWSQSVILGKPPILVTPACRFFWIREEDHTSLLDGRGDAPLRASAENRVNLGASSDLPRKDHVITSHPASLGLGTDNLASRPWQRRLPAKLAPCADRRRTAPWATCRPRDEVGDGQASGELVYGRGVLRHGVPRGSGEHRRIRGFGDPDRGLCRPAGTRDWDLRPL